ncbi:MAG: hypothetical protein KAJ19_28330 [Gammaproteobacteria bacterium]|nr:hypothetical protein [Gammaproteobacteria bacterium]
MAINAYSIQLITTLLDGSTTQIPSPGSASTGSVLEVFGGFPMRIPGGTSDQNIKLGLLSDPLWLAVYGDEGISFQIFEDGTALEANPMAFVADVADGLGISEIWVSNSDAEEHIVYILASQ